MNSAAIQSHRESVLQPPHDVRLIAAVSRLIDIHQSRRESGGVYVPDVPEKAGLNLFLALQVITRPKPASIQGDM